MLYSKEKEETETMSWESSNSYNSYDIERQCPMRSTFYYEDLSIEDIPALALQITTLLVRGFTLVADGPRLQKRMIEREGHSTETLYRIIETAYLEDDVVKVRVRITSEADSPESAIANAQAVVPEIAYRKGTVEGGKGQMKRCALIAADLLARYGDLVEEGGYISVPYWTAGGRGDWKTKKAYRIFHLKDLKRKGEGAL